MPALQHKSDNPTTAPYIPGYRITRVIGHGGMSTVYLGTQLSLSREVAIKVMRADVLANEVSRRRFENEARTIARLEHPHIVNIYEVGRTSEGQPWYSMPYLARGHLAQRDLTHNHAQIRQILEALLSALAFAHIRGVIHRDVKAENILFDETGRPLLADFGIALRRGHGTRVTLTGLAIGSTAYMAPEQARGQQVDLRTDLYSVGVLAWEMLTGQLPYQADDAVAMAVAHIQMPLPRLPSGLRHWQRFMNRALAKQPQKRFHNAEHMLAMLHAVPKSSGVHSSPWRWLTGPTLDLVRTHRALAGAGLAAISILGIGLLLSLPPSQRPAAMPSHMGALPVIERTISDETPSLLALRNQAEAGISIPALPSPSRRPLRTAPTSPASQRLEQIRSLLANKSSSSPHIRQAVDLLIAAHKANPEHLQLPATRDTLLRALSAHVVAAIEDGDDVRAQAMLRQLPRIRAVLPPPPAVQAALHTAIHDAISRRLDLTQDAAIARQGLDIAHLAGLPAEQLTALRSRVRTLEPPPGWISVRVADRLVHIGNTPVSRMAYARFAETTARPAAACRERGSVLRVLAPRDWARPGFAQLGSDPVVCISWQDAADYAAWISQRDGRQYRLLSMAEAAALPVSKGAMGRADGRTLAEWRSDCDSDCNRRIASGRSWRSRQDLRPLVAERGYHDVGLRLAIDPPSARASSQHFSGLNQQ